MNSRGNVVTNSIKTLKRGDGPHQNDLYLKNHTYETKRRNLCDSVK